MYSSTQYPLLQSYSSFQPVDNTPIRIALVGVAQSTIILLLYLTSTFRGTGTIQYILCSSTSTRTHTKLHVGVLLSFVLTKRAILALAKLESSGIAEKEVDPLGVGRAALSTTQHLLLINRGQIVI